MTNLHAKFKASRCKGSPVINGTILMTYRRTCAKQYTLNKQTHSSTFILTFTQLSKSLLTTHTALINSFIQRNVSSFWQNRDQQFAKHFTFKWVKCFNQPDFLTNQQVLLQFLERRKNNITSQQYM